jgi:hypothetical protein
VAPLVALVKLWKHVGPPNAEMDVSIWLLWAAANRRTSEERWNTRNADVGIVGLCLKFLGNQVIKAKKKARRFPK